MIKIVRGNDFNIKLLVDEVTGKNEQGEFVTVPFDLSGASFVNVVVKSRLHSLNFPFEIDKNTVTVHINGREIPCGDYAVEITGYVNRNFRSFKHFQFSIVESDEEANIYPSPSGSEVTTVTLATHIIIGFGSNEGGSVDLSNYYTKDEVKKELEKKVSAEIGKGLSSNDYTDEDKAKLSGLHNYDDASINERMTKLEEDFANITGAVISTEEHKVSVFNYGGKKYDVFELTAELKDLPVIAGESIDIIITDQPCGNNLYLKAECLSVSIGTGDKSDFPVSSYSVKRVYVDDNMNTVATIVCNENIAEVTKAILTVRYVKGLLSFDEIELSIPTNELGIISADEVNVALPELKYNKKMCYQYSMDDGFTGVYYVHWKHIRKNKLCFTNGCGIDLIFAPASAWVTYNAYMIDLHTNTDETTKYCPWIFANKMVDFGGSLYNHGGGKYGATFINDPEAALTYENAKKSYDDNINAIQANAGIFPFVTVTPGGGSEYMQPYDEVEEKNPSEIYAYTSKTRINLETPESILGLMLSNNYRMMFNRRNLDTFYDSDDLQGIVSKIAEAYNANDKCLFSDFSHGPAYTSPESNQQTAREHMDWLHNNYGKAGNDTIWFCPMDEFFEYQLARMLSIIETSVANGFLRIKIKYPKFPHFRYFDSSLIIRKNNGTIGDITTVTPFENIVGLSHKAQSDGGLMVCFNWNKGERSLPDLAEKYTGIYESEQTEDAKWDAMYFVNQLKEDLQAPFLSRINAEEVAPVLNAVSINSGAASTYDKEVNITLNVTGTITHYKASESDDLSGIEWIESTAKNFSFTLSDGFGNKAVYVQVKSSFGVSEIKSATISYDERPAITHTVTTKSNNATYGTVTPASQTVADGGNATVNAQANDGYVIESWSGADSSTGAGEITGKATVNNVTEDKAITCNFKKEEVTPPSDKDKWILSFSWGFGDAVWDSDTGISKQMGTTSIRDLYTSTGDKKGKMKAVEFGSLNTFASLTKNMDQRGAITGDDSGIYPDKYLAQITYPYRANEEGIMKFGYQFYNLPNGNYRVKILASTIKEGFSGTGELGYNINGTEQKVDANFPLNNLSEFIIFDSVAVTDGIIDLTFYNVSDTAKNPMISIIEIEQL